MPRRRVAACIVLAALLALGRGGRLAAPRHRAARASAAEPRGAPAPRRIAGVPRAGGFLKALLLALPRSGAQLNFEFPDVALNEEGVIDKVNFMYAMRDKLDADSLGDKDARRRMFKFADSLYHVCDLDGDGVLTRHEAKYGEYLFDLAKRMAETSGAASAFDKFGEDGFTVFMDRFDTSGDGRIDEAEFWEIHKESLEVEQQDRHPLNPEVLEPFEAADWNGDGFLDVRGVQYASFLVHIFVVQQLSYLMMGVLDLDGDERLRWKELVDYALQSRSQIGDASRILDYVRDNFSEWDANSDGILDLWEMDRLASGLVKATTSLEIGKLADSRGVD